MYGILPGEVSADGHEWSMGAYASDFIEKTWPLNYGHDSSKKHPYHSEGKLKVAYPGGGDGRLLTPYSGQPGAEVQVQLWVGVTIVGAPFGTMATKPRSLSGPAPESATPAAAACEIPPA